MFREIARGRALQLDEHVRSEAAAVILHHQQAVVAAQEAWLQTREADANRAPLWVVAHAVAHQVGQHASEQGLVSARTQAFGIFGDVDLDIKAPFSVIVECIDRHGAHDAQRRRGEARHHQ